MAEDKPGEYTVEMDKWNVWKRYQKCLKKAKADYGDENGEGMGDYDPDEDEEYEEYGVRGMW